MPYAEDEKTTLLALARKSIQQAVDRQPLDNLDISDFSPALQELRATFVTLTKRGALRGCIGALEAYQPLVLDVQEHAVAAATQDYRFPAVKPEEMESINIEISVLTPPVDLVYQTPEELLEKLRPGMDGVIIRDGASRATFLPQVWDQINSKNDFLSALCSKMGASSDLWKRRALKVQTYQVDEFSEKPR